MLKKIIIWLRGYIVLHISGLSKERFINICIKNNINIWNICNKKDCKEIYISKKSFNDIKPFINKTDVSTEIINKCGLPFVFYRYKKRKIFILGLFLFFLTIYSFSFFVWDISVNGESIYTKEQIIKDLNNKGIKIGILKNKINCSEIEKELRKDYDNIAWVSCELNGTLLNININETISIDNIKENTKPCNIIATKSGIITDIILETGTKVVNKGDEVKKGDILITGAINLYNDYDELIETSFVPANGKIYALIQYEYNDIFPLVYYEKQYTGNTKKYYNIIIGDCSVTPYKPKYNYSNYDIITENNKLKFGNTFYLPFSVQNNAIKEFESIQKKYNKKEAENKAYSKLNKYISDLKKKGVEILENNVKIDVNDEECKATGIIVTKELIGVPSDLTIINQGEKTTNGIY